MGEGERMRPNKEGAGVEAGKSGAGSSLLGAEGRPQDAQLWHDGQLGNGGSGYPRGGQPGMDAFSEG